MHFHDRDNLEITMMPDIPFYNLVALIETEGYVLRDYMYYVKDPGRGIEGTEEIWDDDRLGGNFNHNHAEAEDLECDSS